MISGGSLPPLAASLVITCLCSQMFMIQAFRNYQRNVSELSQLTDRELSDIGLDRSDIPRVASGTFHG